MVWKARRPVVDGAVIPMPWNTLVWHRQSTHSIRRRLAEKDQWWKKRLEKAKFGDEILSQKHMPEGGAAATREMTLCLTATQAAVGAQKTWRVWLHNQASKNANVPAGTFIGQGGQGRFVSLVTQSIEESQQDFYWTYTRLTGF